MTDSNGRPGGTGFNAEHERRVLRLFEELLDADESTRHRRLEDIERTDPGLAGEVRRLIRAEEISATDESFLSGLLEPVTADPAPMPADSPERIGAHRVLEVIGEGASGVVYACEDPELERRLAVKVLDRSLLRGGVRERFRREAETLSRLTHPNIAKVYAVDLHDERMPFIAMELVDGPPIDAYLRAHPLTLENRCELFLQIAEAVAHAHTKGVIHRDLKPSNVLVEDVAGRPFARVIDFGVAMTLGLDEPRQHSLTHTGAVLGTLSYMSPEQLRLIDEGVDTRCDVYGLGLLLHEILTGRPAHGDDAEDTAPLMTIFQRMRDNEPPRPSRVVSESSDPDLPYTAVPRELDWIVAKATAHHPADRYSSAEAMAQDIGRFLRGHALEAAPPSRMYLARKFVSRHRAAATAATLVLAVLIAATLVSLAFAAEASRERDIAESARVDLSRQLKVSRYRQLSDAIDSGEWRRADEVLSTLEQHRDEWLWRFFDAILNSQTLTRQTLASPSAIAVSPRDGRLAVGSRLGHLEILGHDGSRRPLAASDGASISSVGWRRDGRALLVVRGDTDWAELTPETGETLRTGRSPSPIVGVEASRDGGYRLVTEGGVRDVASAYGGPDERTTERRQIRSELRLIEGDTLVLHGVKLRDKAVARGVRYLDVIQYDEELKRALVDATTGAGEFLVVIDLTSGDFERVPLPPGSTALKSSLAPDGNTVYVQSSDGLVRVYRVDPLGLVFEFPVPVRSPTAFAVDHAKGEIHLAGHDGILRTWQMEKAMRFVRAPLAGRVHGAGFTDQGAMLAYGATQTPPSTVPSLRVFGFPDADIQKAVPLANGSGWFASSSDGKLRWYTASHEPARTEAVGLSIHRVDALGGDPPGVVAAPYTGGLYAFEANRTGHRYAREDLGFIRSLAAGPASGRAVAADSEGVVHLLDRFGATIRSFETGKRISALWFGRDGRWIAAGDTEGGVTLIPREHGHDRRRLRPHSSSVTSVALLPDRSGVLSAARDERILHSSLGMHSDTVPLPRLVQQDSAIQLSDDGAVLFTNGRHECVLIRPALPAPENGTDSETISRARPTRVSGD